MDRHIQSDDADAPDPFEKVSSLLSLESQNEMRKSATAAQTCEPDGFTKFTVVADQLLTHAVYGGVLGGAMTKKGWGTMLGAIIMGSAGLVSSDDVLEGKKAKCEAEKKNKSAGSAESREAK